MNIACYTSFTFSYLSRARVLAQSTRAAHPDWVLWAILVDLPPQGLDWHLALSDFDRVMFVDEMQIPDWRSWLFKHDIVEACTAVKGHALQIILDEGYDAVVYLDPDIAVFNALTSVQEGFNEASLLLTPHQIDANDDDQSIADGELTSLQYGIFNLGFVGVLNDRIGISFARWWSYHLYSACYDLPEKGIFTDQKYCDLVPALFPRVKVLRDPGLNVASWNLSKRSIGIDISGQIYVNNSPLKFYHFTKIGSAGDVMTYRYAKSIATIEIWEWYRREIVKQQISGIPQKWWAYGTYHDGLEIRKAHRLEHRERFMRGIASSDPYFDEIRSSNE